MEIEATSGEQKPSCPVVFFELSDGDLQRKSLRLLLHVMRVSVALVFKMTIRMSVTEAHRAGLERAPAKYRSERVQVDGIKFDSKREANRYAELKLLERAKEISHLMLQVTYPLRVEGMLITKYRADFVYNDKGGAIVVEDAKGFRTPAYKIKRKLMLALYKIKIKEV